MGISSLKLAGILGLTKNELGLWKKKEQEIFATLKFHEFAILRISGLKSCKFLHKEGHHLPPTPREIRENFLHVNIWCSTVPVVLVSLQIESTFALQQGHLMLFSSKSGALSPQLGGPWPLWPPQWTSP